MVKIVIINGHGGCGKDTFISLCEPYVKVFNFSTVDFVKKIAFDCGWDGQKTPEARLFMSELKRILTEWKNLPYLKTIEQVENARKSLKSTEDGVIFIHCREPQEILKLKTALQAITLLVDRETKEIFINNSDKEVMNMEYDYYIDNNGTIEELISKAKNFLYQIGIKFDKK